MGKVKFYIDYEFDGPQREVVSIGVTDPEGFTTYAVMPNVIPKDPWVKENVMPILFDTPKDKMAVIWPTSVHGFLRSMCLYLDEVEFISDSVTDAALTSWHFCTKPDGTWAPSGMKKVTFTVENVDAYPTTLEGAVQHNAAWDSRALWHKMEN